MSAGGERATWGRRNQRHQKQCEQEGETDLDASGHGGAAEKGRDYEQPADARPGNHPRGERALDRESQRNRNRHLEHKHLSRQRLQWTSGKTRGETGDCPVSGNAASRVLLKTLSYLETQAIPHNLHRMNGWKSDHRPMVKNISLRNIHGKNSRAAAATAARRGTVERV
jgi:hypothetical protein